MKIIKNEIKDKKNIFSKNAMYTLSFILGFLFTFLSQSFSIFMKGYFLYNFTQSNITVLELNLILILIPWLITFVITIFLLQFFKHTNYKNDDNSELLLNSYIMIILGCIIGYYFFLFFFYRFILIPFFSIIFKGINITVTWSYLGIIRDLVSNSYLGFELWSIVFFVLFLYSKKDYAKKSFQMFKFNNKIIFISFLTIIISLSMDFFNQFVLITLFNPYDTNIGLISDFLYLIKILVIFIILLKIVDNFPFEISKKYLKLNIFMSFLIIGTLEALGTVIFSVLFGQESFLIENFFLGITWSYYLTSFLYLIILNTDFN